MSGEVDTAKVIKMLLENGSISEDCVLIIDEIYLKKSVNHHREYVGADAEGNLYQGVIEFLMVSWKNSAPCVVKALLEGGCWLSEESDKSIIILKETGLQVSAVVSDDHASNFSTILILLKKHRHRGGYRFIHLPSSLLRSSYRKLAWVGFEPRTTEFRSDALTD